MSGSSHGSDGRPNMDGREPMIAVRNVSKHFGSVVALEDVSMALRPGEVMALLGDNGAGKSTLIKLMAGVYTPTRGSLMFEGEEVRFSSPRDAMSHGIATVHQDLAMIPLMSIARNFFLGNEPVKGVGPLKFFDLPKARKVAAREMEKIGVRVRDPEQLVGTLSGGERQSVAIARAAYFGAKVLILDEPTSALGVKEAGVVLRYVAKASADGIGVIFISHNVHHAYPVADRFTILDRGRSLGTFEKGEISKQEVLRLMAGGEELDQLSHELERFSDEDRANERVRSREMEAADELRAVSEDG